MKLGVIRREIRHFPAIFPGTTRSLQLVAASPFSPLTGGGNIFFEKIVVCVLVMSVPMPQASSTKKDRAKTSVGNEGRG